MCVSDCQAIHIVLHRITCDFEFRRHLLNLILTVFILVQPVFRDLAALMRAILLTIVVTIELSLILVIALDYYASIFIIFSGGVPVLKGEISAF